MMINYVELHKRIYPTFQRLFGAGVNFLFCTSLIFGSLSFINSLYLYFSGKDKYIAALVAAVLFFAIGIFLKKNKNRIIMQLNKHEDKQIELLKKLNAYNDEFDRNVIKKIELYAAVKVDKIKTKNEFINKIKARASIKPLTIVALGGNGWESLKEKSLLFSLDAQSVYISNTSDLTEAVLSIESITAVEVAGPGTVQNGGGFSGGGFGVEGFVKGAALATVLNLLTTYKSTKTIVRLMYQESEIIFLSSEIDLEEMRIQLSPLFVACSRRSNNSKRMQNNEDVGKSIQSLVELRNAGELTETEFSLAKARILQV